MMKTAYVIFEICAESSTAEAFDFISINLSSRGHLYPPDHNYAFYSIVAYPRYVAASSQSSDSRLIGDEVEVQKRQIEYFWIDRSENSCA